MIYPEFLKEKDTIGVTAPSDGITDEVKLKRLDNAIKSFEERSFNIKETPNVRCSVKGRSASSKERAYELESLYKDNSVKAIITSGGGDFLLEMLSEVDFNVIKDNPKWLQGYSDPTGLLFTITTNLDIATIYGHNFAGFGMDVWHESITCNYQILEGKNFKQNSFPMYEKECDENITGTEGYHLDTPVCWRNLNGEEKVQVSGRMIGGCIDILTELFGTRFDKTKEFLEKYKEDGFIWFFDNCELSCEDLVRTLWKFKDNGWFRYTNAVIFGRSATSASNFGMSIYDAVKRVLSSLSIPIIMDADFGHVPPRMTIINGAYATIISENGKGSIDFLLK